jgi:hypothetical protein
VGVGVSVLFFFQKAITENIDSADQQWDKKPKPTKNNNK